MEKWEIIIVYIQKFVKKLFIFQKLKIISKQTKKILNYY